MESFKNISVALVLSFLVFLVSTVFFGNRVLFEYLAQNNLLLLFTAFAINSATVGVIITALTSIRDETGKPYSFVKTIQSIKNAYFEQVALIVISGLIVIVANSPYPKQWQYSQAVFDVLNLCIFGSMIQILFDTANTALKIYEAQVSKPKTGD